MLFVGIDPGNKGALAALEVDMTTRNITELEIIDMPIGEEKVKTRMRDCLDSVALMYWLHKTCALTDHLICLEHLWDFAVKDVKDAGGAKQRFPLARDYGIILGILETSMLNYRLVSPKAWQNAVHKPTNLGDAGKIWLCDKAKELYPEAQLLPPNKKNPAIYGRGDALLLAHYGFMRHYALTVYSKTSEEKPRVTPRRNKQTTAQTRGAAKGILRSQSATTGGHESTNGIQDSVKQDIRRLFT